MITCNETRNVEKIARKMVSLPGNLSRANANPAIECRSNATTVIVPATKNVLRMYRRNGNSVKTYR